jgi:hypothetical protein
MLPRYVVSRREHRCQSLGRRAVDFRGEGGKAYTHMCIGVSAVVCGAVMYLAGRSQEVVVRFRPPNLLDLFVPNAKDSCGLLGSVLPMRAGEIWQ